MGCLRNVIETKRKISTMIKEQENEKYTNLTCGFFYAFGLRQAAQSTTPEAHPHSQKKRNIHVSQRLLKKKARVFWCFLWVSFLCLIEIDQVNLWMIHKNSFEIRVTPFFPWTDSVRLQRQRPTATKDGREGHAESSQALETLCERIRAETLLKMQPFVILVTYF